MMFKPSLGGLILALLLVGALMPPSLLAVGNVGELTDEKNSAMEIDFEADEEDERVNDTLKNDYRILGDDCPLSGDINLLEAELIRELDTKLGPLKKRKQRLEQLCGIAFIKGTLNFYGPTIGPADPTAVKQRINDGLVPIPTGWLKTWGE